MDVARLNFTHGDRDDHKRVYDMIRASADAEGHAVGILADLQGPKIRLGRFATGPGWIEWRTGEQVRITTTVSAQNSSRVPDRAVLTDRRLRAPRTSTSSRRFPLGSVSREEYAKIMAGPQAPRSGPEGGDDVRGPLTPSAAVLSRGPTGHAPKALHPGLGPRGLERDSASSRRRRYERPVDRRCCPRPPH
jgi:hypothetical protein